MQDQLTLLGTTINVTSCSIMTMTVCNPLFVRKTRIMTGRPGTIPFNDFYKGYGENVACDVTNWVVGFIANHFFREHLMSSKPLSATEQCLGGMFGGAISGPFVGSLERLMILAHLHNGNETPKRMVEVTYKIAKTILHEEGAKGFLKGSCITASREAINYGCLFGLEKVLYKNISPFFADEKKATLVSYLSAGAVSGFITTPIDLIKTLIQEKIGRCASIKSIFSQLCMPGKNLPFYGLHKLFRGAGARTLTVSCSMGLFGFLNERLPYYLPSSLKKD